MPHTQLRRRVVITGPLIVIRRALVLLFGLDGLRFHGLRLFGGGLLIGIGLVLLGVLSQVFQDFVLGFVGGGLDLAVHFRRQFLQLVGELLRQIVRGLIVVLS